MSNIAASGYTKPVMDSKNICKFMKIKNYEAVLCNLIFKFSGVISNCTKLLVSYIMLQGIP